MTRRAFTLVEVLVALTLSALVVTLAYGALAGGLRTRARLAADADGAAREGVVRALLFDALRHADEGLRGGAPVFALVDRVDARGAAADSLVVTTRGVAAPLGAGPAWQVTAWRAGDALHLAAAPVVAAGEPAWHARLPGIVAFDVAVLPRGAPDRWLAGWPEASVAPDAVRLTIDARDRADAGPLVVRRGLERAP